MTTKEFVEKSIEGGWKPFPEGLRLAHLCDKSEGEMIAQVYIERILLDVKAWESVGKSEGWDEKKDFGCMTCGSSVAYSDLGSWEVKMHQMIDALAEGKSIREVLKDL